MWATSWEKIRRGTGQPDREQAFLRRVLSALPEGIEPVVVTDGDSGSGSAGEPRVGVGEGQKEPWYLATDLSDPQEAIRLY